MKLGECRSVVEGTQLFFVVQSLSCVLTLWDPMDWSMSGSSVLHFLLSLLKFMFIELVIHLILCCWLLLQSFQAPGSFPINWLFASGGQSIGASAAVLLVNIQG